MKKIYTLGDRSINDVLNERLEDLDVSAYTVAHWAETDISPTTIFRFFAGKQIHSGKLEQILKACGLALVAVDYPEWAEE